MDAGTQAKVAEARAIITKAKAEDRDLTASEQGDVDRLVKAATDAQLQDEIAEMMGGAGAKSDLAGSVPGTRKTLSDCIAEGYGAIGLKGLSTSPSAIVPTDFLTPPGADQGPGTSPVFDAFPQRRGSGGSAKYLTQTGTVSAAVVAPGADKPVGTWELSSQTDDYVVVATLSPPIANSVLTDGGADLKAFLDGIMGGAVGAHVDAYAVAEIDAAITQQQAYATSVLATIRAGVTKLQTSYFSATHLFLSPADAEGLALISSNPYVFGSPAEWVPNVVVSPAVPAGKAFVADAARSGLAIVREDASVRVDPYTAFEKNESTVLVEARVLFAVTAPMGIVELDLTA